MVRIARVALFLAYSQLLAIAPASGQYGSTVRHVLPPTEVEKIRVDHNWDAGDVDNLAFLNYNGRKYCLPNLSHDDGSRQLRITMPDGQVYFIANAESRRSRLSFAYGVTEIATVYTSGPGYEREGLSIDIQYLNDAVTPQKSLHVLLQPCIPAQWP